MNLPLAFLPSPRTLALCVVIVAAGTRSATAQTSMMPPTQVMPNDRAFITSMLQESLDQLALARLAAQRVSSAEASTAAAETIAEWSSLRSRLISVAYAQGAPVRGALSADGQAMLKRLGRTPATHFDNAFLRDAQRGNQTALLRMQRAKRTSDPKVQRFLSVARPLVSSDEQMTADDLIDSSVRD